MRKLLLTLVFLLSCSPLFATTYHVAANGDDSLTGLDRTNAFLTISKACQTVIAGDTIKVYDDGGTFTTSQSCNTVSGTSSQKITLEAAAGQQPLIDRGTVPTTWTSVGTNIYESNTLGLTCTTSGSQCVPTVWKLGSSITNLTSVVNTQANLDAEDEFFFCGSGCTSSDRIRIYTTSDPNLSTYKVVTNNGHTGLSINSISWYIIRGITVNFAHTGILMGTSSTSLGNPLTDIELFDMKTEYAGDRGISWSGSIERPTLRVNCTHCTGNYVRNGWRDCPTCSQHGIKYASNVVNIHSFASNCYNCTAHTNGWHGFQISEGWDDCGILDSIAYNNNLDNHNDGSDYRIGLQETGSLGHHLIRNEGYGTKYNMVVFGEVNNSRIYGNYFHDATTANVWMDANSTSPYGDIKFHSNILRNAPVGVLTVDADNVKIYNNTFDGQTQYGVEVRASAQNALIKNNAFILPTGAKFIKVDSGGTIDSNYNAYYSPDATPFSYLGVDYSFANFKIQTNGDANSISTDFRNDFINYSGQNFNLAFSGVILKDAGLTLTADVPYDFRDLARPQGAAYAIGAYEEGTGAQIHGVTAEGIGFS